MKIENQVYDRDFINKFLLSINYSNKEITDGASLNTIQVHHLYHIHNEVAFPNKKDFSKSCSACRLRVFKATMIWFNDQEWKEFVPKILE